MLISLRNWDVEVVRGLPQCRIGYKLGFPVCVNHAEIFQPFFSFLFSNFEINHSHSSHLTHPTQCIHIVCFYLTQKNANVLFAPIVTVLHPTTSSFNRSVTDLLTATTIGSLPCDTRTQPCHCQSPLQLHFIVQDERFSS